MPEQKILHIISPDKFTIPFIQLISREFTSENHLFLCVSEPGPGLANDKNNVICLLNPYRKNLIRNSILFYKCIKSVSKIILHGNSLLFYFMAFPGALRKTYWVIYGYEIDDRLIKVRRTRVDKFIRCFVLKRIYGHITHIEGDSQYANTFFNSAAKFFYSPIYLSNVVTEPINQDSNEEMKNDIIRILAGNNNSPTNNHESILKMLLPYKDKNILIYCPLSYGPYDEYRDSIIARGSELFGEKFVPMTEFMQHGDYLNFLAGVDIAIFNHHRQEGMGVIIQLLNLGKVIYMNGKTTSYMSFIKRGLKVFDNSLIEKEGLLAKRDTTDNTAIMKDYYSYDKLVSSWTEIFND